MRLHRRPALHLARERRAPEGPHARARRDGAAVLTPRPRHQSYHEPARRTGAQECEMTAAARHEPQAAAAQPQERKPPLLDRILESTKTQERVVPFLRQGDTDYARVAAAVRLYAQMHPDILGCTGASIQAAIIKVAQWGLEIGETAHLVPYNTK